MKEKQPDERFCPECGEIVKKAAVICVHCGVSLKGIGKDTNDTNKILAIVLTILFPGAGQLIYGQIGLGITFLVLTIITAYVLWIVFMPISLILTIKHYSQVPQV